MTVDTIICNATVHTMEAKPTASTGMAQAIAIGAGRILAVGTNAQIAALRNENTRIIDAGGRVVLPGFIDSHVHFTQTGLGNLGPEVYGVTETDKVLAVVAQAVAESQAHEPLLVHGCALQDLDRELAASDLDGIAPHNPLMVADVGAHACVVNSAAWRVLGLPSDTAGIEITSGGRLTGLLRGAANTRARYVYYSQVIDDVRRVSALRRASQMALEVGITTVHALEGGSPGRGWLPQRDVEVFLDEQARLPIHTVIYFQSTEVELARTWGLPRIGGCVWLDGGYFERTAGLLEPYSDQPCSCGSLYFGQEELDDYVFQAHAAGLQVSMHAIGDAAIEQLLTSFERALAKEPRADHRHRVEHCSLPTARHIEQMAHLGVIASMQPNFASHPAYDAHGKRTGQGLEKLLGTERFERRHPYRRLLDAGILVAAGSDADPMPMGPLIGVQQLASHPERERRLTPHEALRLYTVNAATAAFEEDIKGSLTPGKLADLVMLEGDPFSAPPNTIAGIAVDLTMVAGTVAYQRAVS
jgi:predicted amidohydrolase YtcJ